MVINFDWNKYYQKHKVFGWDTFWEEFALAHKDYDGHTLNIRPDNYDFAKAFRDLDTILHFDKSQSVLDIGCGSGDISQLVRSRVDRFMAVDVSPTMVNLAKDRFDIDAQVARATSLPFADHEFDITYSLGVFQYVSYDVFEQAVKECLRVTKVGGKVFFGDIPEQAPMESALYVYPKSIWNKLGILHTYFYTSYFENRLHVVIIK